MKQEELLKLKLMVHNSNLIDTHTAQVLDRLLSMVNELQERIKTLEVKAHG